MKLLFKRNWQFKQSEAAKNTTQNMLVWNNTAKQQVNGVDIACITLFMTAMSLAYQANYYGMEKDLGIAYTPSYLLKNSSVCDVAWSIHDTVWVVGTGGDISDVW